MLLVRLLRDRVFLLAVALMGLVLAASLLTPVEFAMWAFYLAPIFLVYVWGKPEALYPAIGLVSALILLSLLPGWGNPALPIVAVNRLMGIGAIWILGYYLHKQQRTNETLLVNLTKYAVLFDTAPVGIAVIDAEGRIVETNPDAERILGGIKAAHEQRPPVEQGWQVLRPDGTPMPRAEYPSVRALSEGIPIDAAEMGVVRPDGATIWLKVTAAPLPLAPYGVVAVYTDITTLREVQESLRAGEQRLRYALDAVSDGAWDWNIQTGALSYSEGWLHKLGYAPEDAVANISFWESLVHPEDMARVQEALAAHFAGRTPMYVCENRLRTKWGEYRHNLDRGRVVEWDAEGRPLRMVGADTDITERMQHEAELAQLAAIVESSDDAIVSNDQDGTLVSWNQGAVQLYGYRAEEAVGQPAAMLFAAGREAEAAALLARVLGGQVVRHHETQHVDRSGNIMDVALTISPLRGRDGVVRGTSIIARDITQQKVLERAVLQLNAELEQRVRERTAALEAALAELRETDQLKEAFLAAISHELRTPLTGVLGVAEALELQVSGPLNSRQLEHVRLLRRSGTRLLEMINSILHYTNLLAGQTLVRRQVCVLEDIGMAAVRKVQAQAQLKLLAVEFMIEPRDLAMEVDSEALTQLLYNLLDNAVKFTPPGGAVGLEIRRSVPLRDMAAEQGEAESIQFVVWDTGIGIADGERARIFDAFTQVEGGLARRYEGIGLGLAYAQRMAGLLGGGVVVESAVGSGSRFVVTLPAGEERLGAPGR
jgi:PAS domain S-box-containing protein